MFPIYWFVSVCYVDEDMFQEAMLFCCPFKECATGRHIFILTDAYFNEAKIEWSHCIGICTDEVSSMTRKYNRFVAQTRKRCYSRHPLDTL
jgi:hypothetical protein